MHATDIDWIFIILNLSPSSSLAVEFYGKSMQTLNLAHTSLRHKKKEFQHQIVKKNNFLSILQKYKSIMHFYFLKHENGTSILFYYYFILKMYVFIRIIFFLLRYVVVFYANSVKEDI